MRGAAVRVAPPPSVSSPHLASSRASSPSFLSPCRLLTQGKLPAALSTINGLLRLVSALEDQEVRKAKEGPTELGYIWLGDRIAAIRREAYDAGKVDGYEKGRANGLEEGLRLAGPGGRAEAAYRRGFDAGLRSRCAEDKPHTPQGGVYPSNVPNVPDFPVCGGWDVA